MLTVDQSNSRFLRVRASGRLQAGDYDAFEPAFEAELGRCHIPVALLLDMRGLLGWTPGGLVRDILFDLRHRRSFSKIAALGDRRWHRWITYAGVPVFRAKLSFFTSTEIPLAESWLISGGRAPGDALGEPDDEHT